MFVQPRPRTLPAAAARMLALIYHATVRDIRKSHGNAVVALLLNIVQALIFLLAFWAFYALLGVQGAPIRGDRMLFMMSGIFLFMTHTKAMAAVTGSEGPTSAMMKHAPMTTTVSIVSGALAALYLQVLTMGAMLFFYHVGFARITIAEPAGAFGMVLLAWASGIGVGMVFLGLKPWAPEVFGLLATLYRRAIMIASGKMFVANALPASMLALFDWNPLFHCIDQARGFTFVNYTPYFSSIGYPLAVTAVLIVVGMMLEFRTRQSMSLSWSAKR